MTVLFLKDVGYCLNDVLTACFMKMISKQYRIFSPPITDKDLETPLDLNARA